MASRGDSPNAGLDWGVVLVVEQLRRAVPGGIGTYARGLVAGLASLAGAERPRCRLYASRAPALPDPLDALGFPVQSSIWPAVALVRAWRAGLGRIGREASLVHAVSFAFPPSAAPLTVTVHDLAWRIVPQSFPARGRRWHERALRRVAGQAACTVVPSEATARALREAGVGIGDDRIAVVEAGSDHLAPADSVATNGVLAQLGVAGEYLLAVGTRRAEEEPRGLFAAYALSRQRHAEPLPLVVVGPAGWGVRPWTRRRESSSPGRSPSRCSPVCTRGLASSPTCRSSRGSGCLSSRRCGPVPRSSRAGSRAPPGAAYEVDPYDIEAIAEGLVRVGAGRGAAGAGLVAAGRARVEPLTWRAAAEGHLAVWRRVAGSEP